MHLNDMKWASLAILSVVSPALAAVHEIWWNITYVQDANPDGLQARRVIGINGTWPYVSVPFVYPPAADILVQATAHRRHH